jgi:hypothetical protein
MKLTTYVLIAALVAPLVAALPTQAASLLVSIGVRETGNPNNLLVGANGGSANGIEFINRDGQTLTADGTWQRFVFTPLTDPLTAFAGATANAMLDNDWGTLEHTLGTESVFQEPRFSGSTTANLQMTPNTSLVTNSMAHTGTQSNQIDFEFLTDAPAPANWLRLTTSNTANTPNPLVRLRESVAGGAPLPTTISFWAKAIVIPEPSTILLLGCSLALLILDSRRRVA